MQSTGQTSTQALSFVPMHGSQMMYATDAPSRSVPSDHVNTPGFGAQGNNTLAASSLNAHPAPESFLVPVIMPDRFFGVTPAVIPLAVIEIHQPEALGLEPERLHLVGPAVDDVAQRR